jgi:hypothetical protein
MCSIKWAVSGDGRSRGLSLIAHLMEHDYTLVPNNIAKYYLISCYVSLFEPSMNFIGIS